MHFLRINIHDIELQFNRSCRFSTSAAFDLQETSYECYVERVFFGFYWTEQSYERNFKLASVCYYDITADNYNVTFVIFRIYILREFAYITILAATRPRNFYFVFLSTISDSCCSVMFKVSTNLKTTKRDEVNDSRFQADVLEISVNPLGEAQQQSVIRKTIHSS